MHLYVRSLVAACALVAVTAVGCGESDEEKAQTQVCDAAADIEQQVDSLASLTLTTATVDAVSESLDAIKKDLDEIVDAQGDLADDRKQEVQSANEEFTSEVEDVAEGLTSNLSLSEAGAELEAAVKQLAGSYEQTFAQIGCD